MPLVVEIHHEGGPGRRSCMTGKIGYSTLTELRRAFDRRNGPGARWGYECNHCGLWHATHQRRSVSTGKDNPRLF